MSAVPLNVIFIHSSAQGPNIKAVWTLFYDVHLSLMSWFIVRRGWVTKIPCKQWSCWSHTPNVAHSNSALCYGVHMHLASLTFITAQWCHLRDEGTNLVPYRHSLSLTVCQSSWSIERHCWPFQPGSRCCTWQCSVC